MTESRDKLILAGIPVLVEHRSDILAERLRDLYSHSVSSPSVEASPKSTKTVVIDARGGDPEPPPANPTVEMMSDRLIWGELRDDTFVISDGRSFGLIDYRTGRAELTLHRVDRAARFAATHRIFPTLLGELLRLENRYYLHGAAIASESGGVLLLGDSESGKSTIVYRLMQQGWRYVADDGVLVGPSSDGLYIYPYYREFTLDPAVLTDEDRERAIPVEPGQSFPKVKLELDTQPTAPLCRPDQVFIVKRTDQKSRWESCTPGRTLEEIYRQGPSMLLHPDLAKKHLKTMINLTEADRVGIIYSGGNILQLSNICSLWGGK